MRSKSCRTCSREIVVGKRAVGDGYDVLDAAVLPEGLRGDGCRAVVGRFSWGFRDLVGAVEQVGHVPLADAVLAVHADFEWHARHRCAKAAAA